MSKTARAVAAVVVTVAAIVTLNPDLIRAAVALDLSVLGDAIAPKPPRTSTGSETRWTADARLGVPYAIGRCGLAGDRRFERSCGEGNKYKNVVSIYSVGPIDSYQAYYASTALVPFTSDDGEGATGFYKNRMWLKTQLGHSYEPYLHWTATGSKDTPANHNGMPVEWTAAHRLSGYAASLLGAELDSTTYAGGLPEPLVVGKWVKVYDPRRDSTYPGGAGAHRYAEPSDKAAYLAAKATWSWSDDPNLHGLMWALGCYDSDPDQPDLPLVRSHGLGLAFADIDVPAFVDAANVSLANDWKVGGRFYSTDDPWEVLKELLEAGGAEPILLGDKLSCMVNAPKVSMATLTGADAVGPVNLDAAVPYNERLNTVWASWTVEELNWAVTPAAAPVQVAEYLAVDKGVRSAEMSVPLAQAGGHVGQLARYKIENSRELTNIVIPVKPEHMGLEPGMCFTANEPEWGLNGQKLLIRKRVFDPATMVDQLICRTETDAKHAYALGQSSIPAGSAALTAVDPSVVALPQEGSWTIIGGVVASEGGSLPAIIISGDADAYHAVSIVVDYRQVLATDPVTYGDWQSATFPSSAKTLAVYGVKAGATYQVRIRYITATGVENPDNNTSLGTIVVGGIDAGTVRGVEVLAEIAAASAAAAVAHAEAVAAHAEAVAASAELADEVTRALAAEDTLHASIVSLTTTVSGNTAAISAEAIARASETSSLAASITSLTTTVGGNSSAISALAASSASADAALAGRATALEAVTRQGAPNLLKNSDWSDGLTSWIATGAAGTTWGPYDHPAYFRLLGINPSVAGSYLYQDVPWVVGMVGTLSAEGDGGAASHAEVQFLNAAKSTVLGQSAALRVTSYSTRAAVTNVAGDAPSGTAWARVVIATDTAAPNSWGRIMLQVGASATAWRNDTAAGDTVARISAEEITRASAVSSLASSITSLTSTVAANSSAISSEATTRASADSSLASSITSLTSSVGANSSAISSEATTRATADSSLASSITSLTTTVDGHTASISSQATVLADHSGKLVAYAKYTAAAGGAEAFIEMVAASDSSLLNLQAKSIRLGNGDPVIEVVGGVARMTNVVITGSLITPGTIAVSRRVSYTPGTVSAPTTSNHNNASSETDLCVISQTFNGVDMDIKVRLMLSYSTGTGLSKIGLYEDGSLIKVWPIQCTSAQQANWQYLEFNYTPSAGAHTYKATLLSNGGSTSSWNIGERTLYIQEKVGGYAVDTSGTSHA